MTKHLATSGLFSIGLLSLALLFILAGCNAPCILGSGNVASENRNVAAFDSISLRGRGHIHLVQNGSTGLRVEAEDNVLPYISTSVKDGVLILEINKTCLQERKPIDFYIALEKVNSIEVSGLGDISGRTPITADELNISLSGAGAINLTVNARNLTTKISGTGHALYAGLVQDHTVSISGAGSIAALNLSTASTRITISGAGDAAVAAADALDVQISGSGHVSYQGAPRVSQRVSGTGSVEQVNGSA